MIPEQGNNLSGRSIDAMATIMGFTRDLRFRKGLDVVMRSLCGLCTIVLAALLVIIILFVIKEGSHSLNLDFFVHTQRPVGIPGGGMGNAILGTLIVTGLASAVGLPVGIMCGVYLAEYGEGKFASIVRFLAEVMNGVPTIVAGLVVYALLVVPMRTYSSYAGGVALAMIMIPLVARATEVAVRQVPGSWKEASIALGASPGRTVMSVVLPGAKAGVITGAILAIARVAGETAPLLFTAFGNDDTWPTKLNRATAVLPLQVFNNAMSPYEDLKSQAWAGALVLVIGILILNVGVRVFARSSTNIAEKM